VTLYTGNPTPHVHRAHARGQIVLASSASSHGHQPHRIRIERRSDGQTDAQLGLISEDPIGFAAGDTNISRYVGNSVTGATDPSGFQEDTGLDTPPSPSDRESGEFDPMQDLRDRWATLPDGTRIYTPPADDVEGGSSMIGNTLIGAGIGIVQATLHMNFNWNRPSEPVSFGRWITPGRLLPNGHLPIVRPGRLSPGAPRMDLEMSSATRVIFPRDGVDYNLHIRSVFERSFSIDAGHPNTPFSHPHLHVDIPQLGFTWERVDGHHAANISPRWLWLARTDVVRGTGRALGVAGATLDTLAIVRADTGQELGAAVGGMSGAAIGGYIGFVLFSPIPVLGPIIGGLAGGFVGGLVGDYGGGQVGEYIEPGTITPLGQRLWELPQRDIHSPPFEQMHWDVW
jgi:hypothetical protein